MFVRVIALAFGGLSLVGCATRPEANLTTPIPQLFLEDTLTGRLTGDGVLTNSLTGEETRFSFVINGAWDGKILTLVEDLYTDGSTEQKTWCLTRLSDGRYTGTREDVIGAASAFQDGAGVRLEYVINMSTPVGALDLTFRDSLYLQADGSVRNIAIVSKLGVPLARVDLTMRRAGSRS